MNSMDEDRQNRVANNLWEVTPNNYCAVVADGLPRQHNDKGQERDCRITAPDEQIVLPVSHWMPSF